MAPSPPRAAVSATPAAPRRSVAASAPRSAFLLHRYDWSESSLILDVFTREQGRVVLVAKGAKRPYSQLRVVLLPFQRLHLVYGSRRAEAEGAEVLPLKGAEWAGGPVAPGGSALMSGFYLNELLMKLLARQDPHPVLFDAYALTLPALGRGDDLQAGMALRAFELVLLREIGLLPELGLETPTQQALRDEARYTLRGESGLVPAPSAEPALTGADWRALQVALDQQDLAALQRLCVPRLAELRPLLRSVLHYHLGSATLRTRQLMLELQTLERDQRTPPA